MLNDDATTTPVDDDLPRPPRGRRAASRPSGPPAPVTEVPPARRTRAAAAAVEAPAPVAQQPMSPTENPAGEPSAPEKKPVRRRTRATKPAGAPADVAPAETAVAPAQAESEAAMEQPVEATKPVKKPATRRRGRSAKASEKPAEPTLEEAVAAKPEVGAVSETIAQLVDLAADEQLDADEPIQVLTPEETEAKLAELAAAIAQIDDPEDVIEDVETEGESEEDEDQPRRRRRRRGGRRRRRGNAANEDDDSSEDSEDSEGGSEDADAADDGDVEAPSEGESGATGSTHRRRRRRRRSGEEDTTAAEDDPDTEVVVRVREPRSSRAKKSDEITGIDGSTRMEAKRQRRREGRAAGRRRAPILSEAEFLSRREAVDRVMAIRQKQDYTQIAVLEDGVLVEHYVDRAMSTSLIGNVYLGKVQNVLPGMEAAFIDIGRGRNAVLYAGEVDWDSFGDQGSNKKMEEVFKSGQSVVVQVTKDPVGAKGARLTSHISIPGRYIVYAPGGDLSGISRKLPDTERARLKGILDSLTDDKESFIVRTAAEGVEEPELQRDVSRLKAQWEAITKKIKLGSAPQMLYSEPDATVRIVRDLFTEDFKELVIAGNGGSDDAWESISAYVEHVAPHLAGRMVHWDEAKGDIFANHRVDEQIKKALERKVFLPSGGSLVIDRTEAMTVIDVNTGKFTGTGGNLEATVTSNNLEAAEEIVRQLRLRDIGGIIVIDFIDMVLPSNRELLLRRLVECLGRDRTRHQVAEVTSLGLVQLTRKKIGTGLAEAFTEECETCKGRGYHRHAEPVEDQSPSDGGDRSERRQQAKESQSRRKRGGKKQS